MMFRRSCTGWLFSGLLLIAFSSPAHGEEKQFLNLVSFGRICSWEKAKSKEWVEFASWQALPAESRYVGVVWDEERDIREIRARFAGSINPREVQIQYWFRVWPPDPPTMPTIEDPADDLWKGSWITPAAKFSIREGAQVITFPPLAQKENPKADGLPGVTYRRTLKIRLVLPEGSPRLESIEAFSESMLQPLSVRIEFGCGEPKPAMWSGSLEIFNGALVFAKPWQFGKNDVFHEPFAWKNVRTGQPKGITAELLSAVPSPAGSNDITVVTVRAVAAVDGKVQPRTFSFSTLDLQRGPIYVPDMRAYITRSDDPKSFSPERARSGHKIREQIPLEPEQTYQRASKEIPALDPWLRQRGDKVYLPVAADASWQKFAVEYGGDLLMEKRGTKTKGAELKRLTWDGEINCFRFGTGEKPYYREDRLCRVSVVDDYLPIVRNSWECEGLTYEEEAFATLLEGPLDPNDPGRSEQTPAVLLVQLKVLNAGAAARTARIVFSKEQAESLELSGNRVLGRPKSSGPGGRAYLRAVMLPPAGVRLEGKATDPATPVVNAVTLEWPVAAGGSASLFTYIPFVSDVSGDDADKLQRLDYSRERERVASYWRELVEKTTRFRVPEPKFNALARSVIPHIHISTSKDPKSGLYMVPAASYRYQVYANESCFQAILLDMLGDTERAEQYFKTLTALQGSRSFPGNYVKPHDGVFHGARVDEEYDYTASDYGLDHGTVLWALARHYFYTRDKAWLGQNLPHMLKAIEWIERQRVLTRKLDPHSRQVPEYGLLPAGHLEDNSDWGYWFSVNAYCVAGMEETASALRDIGHPDAGRIQAQATNYRDALRAAVQRSTELSPVTRMRDGTYSPYVPTKVAQRFRYFGPLRVQYYSRYGKPDVLPCYRLAATREVLYGPIILLNLHIFDPSEPIADWILDDWEDNLTLSSSGGFNVHGFTDDKLWFSQGGLVFQSNLQNPILVYLNRREIPAAIRSLYNSFTSCLYPDVNVFTEEYREWVHASGPFYKSPDEARFVNRLRDTLVLEMGDELWLASGVPQRWISSPEGIRVDSINSVFGPVRFTMRAGKDPDSLIASVTPPTRPAPKRLWLYVRLPKSRTIKSVELGGQPWNDIDAASERIAIPTDKGGVEVLIRY